MPASTELSEAVLGQRRLLERLLVHRRRDTGEEPSLRSPDAGDAEFVKNLQIFLRLVVDADALYLRAAHSLSGDPAQAAAVTGRVEELRDRITLPTEVPLTLELLLARRFELERLLIELGDRTYLAGRLADLYDEQPGTVSTWRSLYGDELPALLPGGVTRHPRGGPPPPGARGGRGDPRAAGPADARQGVAGPGGQGPLGAQAAGHGPDHPGPAARRGRLRRGRGRDGGRRPGAVVGGGGRRRRGGPGRPHPPPRRGHPRHPGPPVLAVLLRPGAGRRGRGRAHLPDRRRRPGRGGRRPRRGGRGRVRGRLLRGRLRRPPHPPRRLGGRRPVSPCAAGSCRPAR